MNLHRWNCWKSVFVRNNMCVLMFFYLFIYFSVYSLCPSVPEQRGWNVPPSISLQGRRHASRQMTKDYGSNPLVHHLPFSSGARRSPKLDAGSRCSQLWGPRAGASLKTYMCAGRPLPLPPHCYETLIKMVGWMHWCMVQVLGKGALVGMERMEWEVNGLLCVCVCSRSGISELILANS